MLAVTHLVVSLLLIQLLMLDRNDAFVALVFGVFIDVDHLFGLRHYVAANGIMGLLNFEMLMNDEGQWKSMLHSPAAVMVVGPTAVASRLAIPLVFWGVHMTMDHLEDAYLGLFSGAEMLLLAAAFSALVWMRYRAMKAAAPEHDFARYVRQELASISSFLGRFRRAAPGSRSE